MDIQYYENIVTNGSLLLAQNAAASAPTWELYRAWEVDTDAMDAYVAHTLQGHATAHTLGHSLLSRPEHEFKDGEEFINRFKFKRSTISIAPRKSKILTTKQQREFYELQKRYEKEKKRSEALSRADENNGPKKRLTRKWKN